MSEWLGPSTRRKDADADTGVRNTYLVCLELKAIRATVAISLSGRERHSDIEETERLKSEEGLLWAYWCTDLVIAIGFSDICCTMLAVDDDPRSAGQKHGQFVKSEPVGSLTARKRFPAAGVPRSCLLDSCKIDA
jgi:hypothetical protein